MKNFTKSQFIIVSTGISCALLSPYSLADNEHSLSASLNANINAMARLKVNCHDSPHALKHALKYKSHKALKLIISGTCEGPIVINRAHQTVLQNKKGEPAIITVVNTDDHQAVNSAIKITNSKVILEGLHFNLADSIKMLDVEHNAVVNINSLSSDYHLGNSSKKPHIEVLGNSSVIVTNQQAADFRIRGSSYAQFDQGNQQLDLIISDTSSVLAKAASEFTKIDLWGNAHLETNDDVSINALSLFGKSSAEILSSQVSTLTMGGRTMFAAYEHSTVNGPYAFYTDNYIFELIDSSLNNWTRQAHDNALTVGFNAIVNGHTYSGWSWSGQDGKNQ